MLFNYSNSGFPIRADGLKQLVQPLSLLGGSNKGYLTDLQTEIDANGGVFSQKILDDVNSRWTGINKSVMQYAANVQNGNVQLKAGQTLVGGLQIQFTSLKSLANSFVSVIGKLGTMALNGLVAGAITWGVTELVSKLNDLRKEAGYLTKGELKDLREELKSVGEQAASTIDEINNNYKKQVQTVGDVSERYATLAQGVKDLGLATQSQGSLNTEEYKEFLDLSNQLSEVFPSLKTGITDEGDALLSLNGSTKTITDSLKALLETERELAAQEIQEKLPEVWAAHGAKVGDASTQYNEAQAELNKYLELQQKFKDNQDMTWEEFERTFSGYRDISKLFDKAGLDYEDYTKQKVDGSIFKDIFDNIIKQYQGEMADAEAIIEAENRKLGSLIATSLQGNVKYDRLGEGSKNVVNQTLGNLHYDSDYNELRNSDDWDKVYSDIEKRVLNSISRLEQESPELAERFNKAYDQIFNFSGSNEASIDEYLTSLDLVKDTINSFNTDEDTKNAMLAAIPDETDVQNKINHFKEIMGTNWRDDLLKEFNAQELDLIASISLKPGSVGYTKDEIEELINPIEIDPKVSASDAVDSMNDAKTAITSLAGLYEQTVTKTVKDGLATGYADPATLTSIRTAFNKFSDDLEKKGDIQGADTINAALKEFETTLIEFPNDADKAQAAMNKLATKYIDQTEIIKNLDEANAEWSKAQLKAMGVTNADEVVQSRLSKQVKATAKAIANLSDELLNYNEVMENSNSTTQQKTDALSNLTGYVNSAIANYDENGNEMPESVKVSDGFVRQHMADIQAMANNDEDALNRVRMAAARGAVMEVTTNVPTEVAEQQIQGLMDMVAQADAMNIETGASIDDTQFIAALNAMIKAAGYTQEQVNAAFNGMGYTVKFKTTKYAAKLISSSNFGNLPASVQQQIKALNSLSFEMPEVEFIGKTGGTPASVNYNGSTPSGSNSGGDTGGGNGNDSSSKDKNKVQKETAESFDWIEVKIKRLEEAIARLDRDATNVYKNWTDRNNALSEEMKKLTKEIDLQDKAAKKYGETAKRVTATGQVLTEGQQEKFDKANKAWTKDLQEDIKDGIYTTKKGKLNKKKLKKTLGESYNSYIESAAEELFSIVKYNKKTTKKNEELKKKGKKTKKLKSTKGIIVGDSNKPKKSDYDDNTAQYKADLKAWKEAQKEWATGEYQKKIREGKLQIEDIDNKYLIAAINKETEIVQKEIDAYDQKQQKIIELADKHREEIDNTIEKWDQLTNLIERQRDAIDRYNSLIEAHGYWISTKSLKDQIAFTNKMIESKTAERDKLIEQANAWLKEEEEKGGVDKESKGYKQMIADIDDVQKEIDEMHLKNAEYLKQEHELIKEQFDYLEERLDGIKDEAEFLSEMASLRKLMDEYGQFNDRGMANLAMVGTQFEEAKRKLEDYAGRIKDLQDQLNADPLNEILKAELDETWQAYRDAGSELKSSYDTIVSTFKEAIDANLSKLKELMDEYKNTLSAAKDLYEFQKNIGNQTKNIENLRKQLVAYQGDDSEAGRKRRQELTNQLNSAEQQLQETEWDRYINQTGEMLDNLYNDYEETLNARLDNVDFLVQELINEVNSNPEAVINGLNTILTENGLNSQYFSSLLNSTEALTGENGTQAKILNSLDQSLTEGDSSLAKITQEVYKSVDAMKKAMDDDKTFKSVFGKLDKLVVNEDGSIKVVPITQPDGGANASNNGGGNANNSGGGNANGGGTTDKKTDDKIAKEEKEAEIAYIKAQIEKLREENKTLNDWITNENKQKKSKRDTETIQKYQSNIQSNNDKLEYLNKKLAELNTNYGYAFGSSDGREPTDADKKEAVEEIFGDKKLFVKASKKKDAYGKFNQYVYEKNDGYVVKSDGLKKLRAIMSVATNDELLEALKKLKGDIKHVKGFAKGSKGISSSQLAWTNENWEKEGGELIFRKSDGAVLTPLNQGDMVFTADMTQRLWEIAQGMIPTSVGGQKLPNISSNNHSTVNTNNQITISLPNVNDYDSFKRELQNDSRFEKFIQEVTIGQAMGNNTLNKRKY